MQIETHAIRLPPGTPLRDWLAEHRLGVTPPTEAERAQMQRLADVLEAKGPIGRRKDHDDRIDLRYGTLRITVVAHGAIVVERIKAMDAVKQLTGLIAGDLWFAKILQVDHGLVLYDPDDDLAVAPPGVDLGPGPYAPPKAPRWRRWRR
jgi:hypothetical protein